MINCKYVFLAAHCLVKDVELLENVVFTILYQEQVKETQETIVRLRELDVYTWSSLKT